MNELMRMNAWPHESVMLVLIEIHKLDCLKVILKLLAPMYFARRQPLGSAKSALTDRSALETV